MKQKLLTLKVREDLHHKWKVRAAEEKTTMSEIAERLIEEYLKRRGGK